MVSHKGRLKLVALFLLPIALVGCTNSEEAAPTKTSDSVARNADRVNAGDFNASDTAFATHLIPQQQLAVDLAALATSQAATPALKELASRIVDSQESDIGKLATLLESWGQPAPEDPGIRRASHDGAITEEEVSRLQAARGPEFDRLFRELMIRHHQNTMEVADKEIAEGANTGATNLARDIVRQQQTEITQLQAIRIATR